MAVALDWCYYYYVEQFSAAPRRLKPSPLCALILHPKLSEALLFIPPYEVPISFKSFLMTSSIE